MLSLSNMNSFHLISLWSAIATPLILPCEVHLTSISMEREEWKLSLSLSLTWKLGVLLTPYAFFCTLLRIGVSGAHLAVEWAWFVAESAWLTWEALWGVRHPCVGRKHRAWERAPSPVNTSASICCFCTEDRDANSNMSLDSLFT